jgi:hypothetical protein
MILDLNKHYRVSKDVIAKEIEGELIIVPLKEGLGDLDAEMYALNTTGLAVWNKLDGTLSIDDLIKSISAEYGMPYDQIKMDVTQLLENLIEKGLVVDS